MEPLADYLTQRLDALPRWREVLRPPGALEEKQFLETCYRCGNCVGACPAKAIRAISGSTQELNGTPYIDPDRAACVLCDELACVKACPSGALKRIENIGEIHMGVAHFSSEHCLRNAKQLCQRCVDKCPLGEAAIGVDSDQMIQIHRDVCVGCGTCQFFCPTTPKAIRVDCTA